MVKTVSNPYLASIELLELISRIKDIDVTHTIADITIKGSEGVALQQEAAGAGAWISPISSVATNWSDKEKAYDTDTGTYADYALMATEGWTQFITMLLPAAAKADKLRVWLDATDNITLVDIDVFKDGVWTHVYEGDFIEGEYMEKSFAQGNVTYVRVRLYKDTTGGYIRVYEVYVWQVPTTGGELKVKVIP